MCENSCLENHYCIDLRRQELAKVGVGWGSSVRQYECYGVDEVLQSYECDNCGSMVRVGGGGLLGTGVNVV